MLGPEYLLLRIVSLARPD